MMKSRLVEHIFFFGVLGLVSYLMWRILAPFFGALVLAAVIGTVCYPFHERLRRLISSRYKSVSAFISVLLVILVIFAPLSMLGYILFTETATFYTSVGSGGSISLNNSVVSLERFFQQFVPGFTLDVGSYAVAGAGWVASNIGTVFASTASTLFLFFITVIALYYIFRDGQVFTKMLVRFSPLPDSQDEQILRQLSRAVRSVMLGTLAVSIVQGVLTAIGFTIFGIDHAVLWGSVAAIGALIPGVGTTIVFLPAILFLFFSGSYGPAVGLLVWGVLAVGLVDNLLGPYLVSRGVTLHPFVTLLSVLGGIMLMGPIGFIVGPVALALFMVLLEIYKDHVENKTSA